MLSGESYLNKDIPLQMIKRREEVSPRTTTLRSMKSTQKQINCISNLPQYTDKNLKQIEDAEKLPKISISNSQPNTFFKIVQQIILKYFIWLLIFLIVSTFICFVVYIVLNLKQTYANSVYSGVTEETMLNKMKSLGNTIDSEVHTINQDIKDSVLKGSTTLLRPIITNLTKSDLIEKTQFAEVTQNVSSTKNTPDPRTETGKKEIPQCYKVRSEIISLLGFTSGHQNNFGIPIEEDERILKLLNEKLHLLEKETETSIMPNQTESTLIVSPTLPLILHKTQESSTRSGLLEETQCKSTSLDICRGVMQYDLTVTTDLYLSLTPSDLNSIERLFSSNCSSRTAQFVCSIMEPECRPMQTKSLQPCKRFCKSILESCSALIFTSDILTYMFDCDKYPDSSNNIICEDPTRQAECYENEFKCNDFSCIPRKWLCDNIKDCENGDDEINCHICDINEFRCKSNDMCLLDQYRCDLKEDCSDGSDEQDCFAEFENEQVLPVSKLVNFFSLLKLNYTDRNLYNAVFDDDRLPAESEFNESVITHTTLTITTESGLLHPSSSSTYSMNLKSIVEENNQSGMNYEAIPTTFTHSCIDDQLRCVSGKCISVSQLCDKVLDCPEGEDEMMCGSDENQHRP